MSAPPALPSLPARVGGARRQPSSLLPRPGQTFATPVAPAPAGSAGKATLFPTPITLRQARQFVARHHRHHGPPRGHKFSIGATLRQAGASRLVGVVIVGRPVARALDDGFTAEITRCCTDGTRNACSLLYGAAWRAARAMGYRRIITYTLADEPGRSLHAAGFVCTGTVRGGSWNCPSRPRDDDHPTGPKKRWEICRG